MSQNMIWYTRGYYLQIRFSAEYRNNFFIKSWKIHSIHFNDNDDDYYVLVYFQLVSCSANVHDEEMTEEKYIYIFV